MRLDLFKDLWLERRRSFAFWCVIVVGWCGVAALFYPLLAGDAWVDSLADWFNPLLESQQAYWLLVLAVFGLPVIGGVFAFWEGGKLFKGQAVRHSIAFLLAYPLPRWQVYLTRLVYLLSSCFLLTVVGLLSGSGAILLTGSQLPAGYWGFLFAVEEPTLHVPPVPSRFVDEASSIPPQYKGSKVFSELRKHYLSTCVCLETIVPFKRSLNSSGNSRQDKTLIL